MGLNLGMLYTEDTYEVPEQPFFGYKRGRYTYEELKALDDFADVLGIELCPCIQALGHLKRILHWPAFRHLRDNDEVLLADLDETYVLLEQMIRAASAPYRSRRIHLGMDEAFGVGVGEHLRRFGYEDPHSVIGRHLSRVLEITDKYGLQAMMWSDMYFHLDGATTTAAACPPRRHGTRWTPGSPWSTGTTTRIRKRNTPTPWKSTPSSRLPRCLPGAVDLDRSRALLHQRH